MIKLLEPQFDEINKIGSPHTSGRSVSVKVGQFSICLATFIINTQTKRRERKTSWLALKYTKTTTTITTTPPLLPLHLSNGVPEIRTVFFLYIRTATNYQVQISIIIFRGDLKTAVKLHGFCCFCYYYYSFDDGCRFVFVEFFFSF